MTIEYLIDPARAGDFVKLIRASRRSRLRQGALQWELLRDVNQPGRYLEQIVNESAHQIGLWRISCGRE